MRCMAQMGLVVAAVVAMAGTALADDVKGAANTVENKMENAANKSGKVVNDSWITAKTKIALYADSRVAGTKVDVETKNGVVMLKGKVDTAEAKEAAGALAKGIDGVKSVRNDLQVVAPHHRDRVDAKDDAIQKHIEKGIEHDALLRGSNIDVRSDAGVITLSGKARSWMQAGRASEIARWTAGVSTVKNQIAVEE